MLASFQKGELESALDGTPRSAEVPGPEAGEQRDRQLLEIREVTQAVPEPGAESGPACYWVRTAGPVPDDALSQAGALTYLSDMGTGFGSAQGDRGRAGPSLDHAVWFHEPVRADDWVLIQLWPRKAMGIRGLYERHPARSRRSPGGLGGLRNSCWCDSLGRFVRREEAVSQAEESAPPPGAGGPLRTPDDVPRGPPGRVRRRPRQAPAVHVGSGHPASAAVGAADLRGRGGGPRTRRSAHADHRHPGADHGPAALGGRAAPLRPPPAHRAQLHRLRHGHRKTRAAAPSRAPPPIS